MTLRRGLTHTAALTVIATAVLSGCGDDGESTAVSSSTSATFTTTTSAATSAPASAEPGTASSSSAGAPETVESGLTGGAQTISGDGYTIRAQITGPATLGMRNNYQSPLVLIPVSIQVLNGSYDLGPGRWVLRTLNGQEIPGSSIEGVPNALGSTSKITGRVEGTVPFPISKTQAAAGADTVSLAQLHLTENGIGTDTIGQWNWPTPVAADTLPTTKLN